MTSDLSRVDWESRRESLNFPSRPFIGGAAVEAQSEKSFKTIDPASGSTLVEVAACDASDVDRAVASARTAYEDGGWSRAGHRERRRVLLAWADLIRKHAHELALLDSLDMGKPINDALGIEVPAAAETFEFYAEALDKMFGQVAPAMPGVTITVTRAPLGVVGAITAWNFPLDGVAWKIAPALAVGNSVVLKPSERSPLVALRLAELGSEAGLPDGVLNVVPGFGPEAGSPLASHNDVDALTFTGSTAVGKQLMVLAGQSNLKKVSLECGGKSPNIVFADVEDLEAAADAACGGIFFNQGETCSANSRLFAHRDIADELLELISRRASEIVVGHPLDPTTRMGPLVDSRHADHVEAMVGSADSDAIRHGGRRLSVEGSDCYFEPTVVSGVPQQSMLAREEIFGPVLVSETFDDEDDAVRMANDSNYGLSASLWTSNLARAFRVSERIVAGTVAINTVNPLSVSTPFGGFKQTGSGRDLSLHALENYTGLKTTWIAHNG
jgi:gamma-glutamyl-gamma-aminobutyraldehyde dehydrogenase